jgi:2'-5' RNA ligase
MRSLYLLAILPPPLMSVEIHQVRQECADRFKVYKALRPPIHITLYKPFHADEALEKRIINLLAAATKDLPSFIQHLEDFGSFRKKVVYINALKSRELINLQAAVKSVIISNQFDPKPDEKDINSFHPHITIAYRDISAGIFQEIWKEYENRDLKLSFPVEDFTLLKHQHEKWNPVFSLPGMLASASLRAINDSRPRIRQISWLPRPSF